MSLTLRQALTGLSGLEHGTFREHVLAIKQVLVISHVSKMTGAVNSFSKMQGVVNKQSAMIGVIGKCH